MNIENKEIIKFSKKYLSSFHHSLNLYLWVLESNVPTSRMKYLCTYLRSQNDFIDMSTQRLPLTPKTYLDIIQENSYEW